MVNSSSKKELKSARISLTVFSSKKYVTPSHNINVGLFDFILFFFENI